MGKRIDPGALGFLFDEAEHFAEHIARRRDAMEIEPPVGKPARFDRFLAAFLQPRRIDDEHEPSLSFMKLAVLSKLLQGAPFARIPGRRPWRGMRGLSYDRESPRSTRVTDSGVASL